LCPPQSMLLCTINTKTYRYVNCLGSFKMALRRTNSNYGIHLALVY
jgi:hypothetical protein